MMGSYGDIEEVDLEEERLIAVVPGSESEMTEIQENKCMVWIGDGYCEDSEVHQMNSVRKDGFLEVGRCLDLCMQTENCVGATYETSGDYQCFLHHAPGVTLKGKWDGERKTESTQSSIDSSTGKTGVYCYRTESGGICPQTVSPSFITRHKLNRPDGHPDGCQAITIPVFCLNAIFDIEEDRTWFPGSCTDHDPEFIEVTQFRPIGIRSFRPLDCDGDGNYQRYKMRSFRRQFPKPSGWHVSMSIYNSLDCTGKPLVTLYRGELFLNTCRDEGFMYVKKTCSEGAIIAKGYDTSDCTGDGVDLGKHFPTCTDKYGLSSEMFDMRLGCPAPRICCKAMTAQCLSCLSGESIEEFCQRKPHTMGCPEPEDSFQGISYYEDWPEFMQFLTDEPDMQMQAQSEYGRVLTTEWCVDNEDRTEICNGNGYDCLKAGMELCDSAGDACFGVMIHPGWWTEKFKAVKLCTSARMSKKDDWLTRMKPVESDLEGMTLSDRGPDLLVESFLPLFEEESRINALESTSVTWGYPSNNEEWGKVSPTCYNSQKQSPIDLPSFLIAENRPSLIREYTAVKTKAVDTGHSIQWDLQGSDGVGFHAHISSEHSVMGSQADIEFHFVHKASDGTFSVTGLLCNSGDSNLPFWRELENSLEQQVSLSPTSLLDSINLSQYFTYYGSFTTPPCDEGVSWVVIADFCTIPESLLTKLKAYPSMQSNYRYTQPLHGRVVSGVMRSVTASIAPLSPYPGVNSDDSYSGSVILRFYGTSATIHYELSTFDSECINGAKDTPNSCGIHIHSGTSCDDASKVGGHFWKGDEIEDPWMSAIYSGSIGRIAVEFGHDISASEGRAFVVHDSNGNRITCDIIGRDTNGHESFPLHKSRIATRKDMLSIWKNRLGTFLETDYKNFVPTLWFFRESIKGPVGIHSKKQADVVP